MDASLLNLLITLALLVVTFAFRKRILRALGKLLIRGLLESVGAPQDAFWVESVSKAEDGTETTQRALSGPWRAYLAGIAAAVFAETMKKVKLNVPAGLPAGFDMSKMSEALPQLIMAMPGRNLNLGGFKIPKEIAAALSSLAAPFLPTGKPAKPKAAENPFLQEVSK